MSVQMKFLIMASMLVLHLQLLGQGLNVEDGAYLKMTGGAYIKITGSNANLGIDTTSVMESSGSIYIDGNFSSHGTSDLNASQVELQGNWLNKGSFDAGTSIIKFTGVHSQTIYHQGAGLYHLDIDKSANAVQLDTSLLVNGQVSFSNGMLITSNDTLVLGSNASLVNERDDNYAQGFVNTSRPVNSSNESFGEIGVTLDATINSQNLGVVTVTRAAGILDEDVSYITSADNSTKRSIDRIWTFSAQYAPADSVELIFNWIQDNDNGNTDLDSMYVYINSSPGQWDTLGSVKDASSRVITSRTVDLTAFTVGPKMIFPFIADFTATTVCLGTTTEFTDRSTVWGTGLSYEWDFNNDGLADNTTAGDVSFTYLAAGTYTAVLKITNNEGAEDRVEVPITIHPTIIASFSVNSVCAGNSTSFTDLSTSYSGVTYTWDFNKDGIIDNTTSGNVTYTYPAAGAYEAVLTLTGPSCFDRDTVDVLVHEAPTVNAGSDKEVIAGSSVTLETITTGTIESFSWSPSTYLNDANTNSLISTPENDITYTVTVTTADGCEASDEVIIRVIKNLFIPTGFTPDGDGVNDSWEIPDLNSYPSSTIIIFDRAGQQVFEGGVNNFWDGTYNGKNSPTGSYYYIINLGNGTEALTGYLTLIRLNK